MRKRYFVGAAGLIATAGIVTARPGGWPENVGFCWSTFKNGIDLCADPVINPTPEEVLECREAALEGLIDCLDHVPFEPGLDIDLCWGEYLDKLDWCREEYPPPQNPGDPDVNKPARDMCRRGAKEWYKACRDSLEPSGCVANNTRLKQGAFLDLDAQDADPGDDIIDPALGWVTFSAVPEVVGSRMELWIIRDSGTDLVHEKVDEDLDPSDGLAVSYQIDRRVLVDSVVVDFVIATFDTCGEGFVDAYEMSIAPSGKIGDYNRDGDADAQDIADFFDSYVRGAKRSDLDGDGQMDVDDILIQIDQIANPQ